MLVVLQTPHDDAWVDAEPAGEIANSLFALQAGEFLLEIYGDEEFCGESIGFIFRLLCKTSPVNSSKKTSFLRVLRDALKCGSCGTLLNN
jgi:hypothetical protein